jgi:hypothetical protein
MKRWLEQVGSSLPAHPARRLTALAVAVSGMAVLGGTQMAAPAVAAPGDGTIKVRVVQDYNGDGGWDDPFIEPGLAGVTVRVTDQAGATQDLTTDADGMVDIVGPPGSYRIVAINPDPATLEPAPAHEKTGTAETPAKKWLSPNEEFVTVNANQTVEMTTAFWDSSDYCQSNPLIVTACQPPMFNSGGGLANNADGDTLVTAPYRAEGADVGKTTLSNKAETGALYGIGYRRQDKRVFAGAFAKRGSAYGPGGAGAIYVTDANGGPATLWGTVPNVGTRAHTNDTLPGGRLDWNFAPAVGKESLGDLDVSEDGDDLQVINLFERKLYVYDASAATMGAPTHVVDLSANPGCAAASDWRPAALGERKGVLYVGGVCSAESSQSPADMRAIVLTYDASTYAPIGTVMDQPLTARREGNGGSGCWGRDNTTYRPWNDEGITCGNKSGQIPDPQAWLTDIVVENDGSLILGFRDRTGDQMLGVNSIYFADTTGTGGSTIGTVNYNVTGDINKACIEPGDTTFTLDMNGACGVAPVAAGQVSGEYFKGDATIHAEAAFGGMALSRGERGVASNVMDPAGIFTQGYASISRGTGNALQTVGSGATGDPDEVDTGGGGNTGNRLTGADGFGKGQGMADMEVLCDFAPIQIGNRVWDDENGDGIQDPGEAGIAGVTVNLYDDQGNLVATKVTNSRGEYYFDSVTDGVGFNTDYVIRLDKPEDYTGSGKLAGVTLSDADQGTGPEQDRLDSDGTTVGGYPEASITTGNRGENDHTIDFGFSPASVSVGNYVWIDSNGNGIQDPGESGIPGVVLELTDANGDPVVDVNGDPVGPVTTDANGHYLFDKLPVLPAGEHYTVTIDQTAASTQTALAPYDPSPAGQGGDPALDSSLWTADSTDLTTAGAKDLTLDFGFTPKPVAVGDFVWVDTDGDGVQDPGEPGIPGVTLTLVGPDGNPVPGVGPAVTDANGFYSFTDLPVLTNPDDRYTVRIDNSQPALAPYVPTQAGQGGDPTKDSSTGSATSGPLTQPEDRDMTLDFGFVPAKVSVGDLVWADTDRDGVQDAGEPGIKGVVLTIEGPDGEPVTDIHGNVVGPVTTDADGNYSFDDLPVLPAGQHYTVKIDRNAPSTVTALADYIPTQTGQGTPATDSSTWEAESGDLTGDGDRDPTLDFGFVRPAVSVGNLVWVDADRDGIQDAGEAGIPGVVLVLTGPDGKPVTDVYGNPVGPVTTDANGAYLFDGLPLLPSGQTYTVSIDRDAASTKAALAPYGPTQAGAGGDRGADSSTWSAESQSLFEDGDSDLTLDFGFVLLPATVTLTTETSHAEAKVGVALSDVVTISGFRSGGTATGSATLYGPFSSPGAATCTPATAVGTVAFTPQNGRVTTPSITVKAPGYYTWVASTTADDLNQAATHACGLKEETSLVRRAVNPVRVIDTGFEGTTAGGTSARKAQPAKLGFAKLGIQAKVKPIGVTGKKANVPANRNLTGWLRTSAELGDVIGTAVIVGHVSDNHDRPGAFFDLKKAKKGQTVELTDKSGVVRTYKVVKTKRYLRSKLLPKKLFSMTSKARVQLVTCTDKVTYGNGRFHYRKNLVVTLVPVS